MPDSHATETTGEVIIHEQHPTFLQVWSPSERRVTCLDEHVGATIMDIRKARLDSFLEFRYNGRREIQRFLQSLARAGPNADKALICQPPIQDFRITYRPTNPSARLTFVDIYEVEGITFGAIHKAARKLVERNEPYGLRAVDPSSMVACYGRPTMSFGFPKSNFLLNSKSHHKLQRWTPGKVTWVERQSVSGAQEKIIFSGQLSGRDVECAKKKRNEDHFPRCRYCTEEKRAVKAGHINHN
jgi:hypothetical protein